MKAVLADLRVKIDNLAPVNGDRMPPERELRDILGCSRETLRALSAPFAKVVLFLLGSCLKVF